MGHHPLEGGDHLGVELSTRATPHLFQGVVGRPFGPIRSAIHQRLEGGGHRHDARAPGNLLPAQRERVARTVEALVMVGPAAAKSSPVSPPKSSPQSGSRGRPVCPRGLSQSAAVSGEMVGRAHSGSLSRATSPPEARPRQPPECVSLLAHSRRQRRRSTGLARHRRATTPKPIVRLGRFDRGCSASVGVSSGASWYCSL